MTIKEFMREELNRRAEAAKVLADDIKVNDIDICGGCFNGTIKVWNGIEEIAEIMGKQVVETTEKPTNGFISKVKSVEVNGTRFCQTSTEREKGDETDE